MGTAERLDRAVVNAARRDLWEEAPVAAVAEQVHRGRGVLEANSGCAVAIVPFLPETLEQFEAVVSLGNETPPKIVEQRANS